MATLWLSAGKVQTPHKIMGGGQEQSPTLATPPSFSKPSRWRQPPRVTRKTIANQSPSASRCKSMIDTLKSLNLTQRSQSNAKKMSWDERGCFGSAQCAHKKIKSPRVKAKSWPTHIYRCTPSNRAVMPSLGLKSQAIDALTLSNGRGTLASVARMAAMCPTHLNSNGQFQLTDASIAAKS
jgi:hypothetical protein